VGLRLVDVRQLVLEVVEVHARSRGRQPLPLDLERHTG
jgi:hypothetical protein